MRVLLVISDYKAGFPYIQDLERELKAKKVFVDILDVENLYLIGNDGVVKNISRSELLKKLLKLPLIRTYVRIFLLKRLLKRLKDKYDAVGIHSCDAIYIHLIQSLKQVSYNLSVTFWGSDFYRASDKVRQKKRKVLDQARLIIFGNPSNEEDFINYYKKYWNKTIVCGFGVTKFDTINKILADNCKEKIKKELGLPTDKLIVTIGYNATPGQQHEKLIAHLAKLPDLIKQRIFLLLQMSYGGTDNYRQEVALKAKQSGIAYKLFNHFLDDETPARIRIATDIVLNAQVTDGFSASIQEHLYAKNIVIVGDWLRYKSLDSSGVFYMKARIDNFDKVLQDVLDQYDHYKVLVEDNPSKIYALSSWNNRISDWISIYEGRIKKEVSSAVGYETHF